MPRSISEFTPNIFNFTINHFSQSELFELLGGLRKMHEYIEEAIDNIYIEIEKRDKKEPSN